MSLKTYVLIVLFVNSVASLFEGDVCTFHDGSLGTCSLMRRCKPVLDLLGTYRVRPIICGFNVIEPVVCCPSGNVLVTQDRNYTYVHTDQRISQKKCREYSYCEIINSTSTSITRSTDNTKTDGDNADSLTVPSQFPHMVAVGFPLIGKDGHLWSCDGTLVSDDFVLTAAHCTYSNDRRVSSKRPTTVRVGETNLLLANGRFAEDIGIVQIINHPQYNPPQRYHDISLLKLRKSIKRGLFSKPLCLWESVTFPSKNALVAGWGTLDFVQGNSSELRKQFVSVIDNEDCSALYGNTTMFPRGITSDQLCAGYSSGAKYTCRGDTSSPLQIIDPHFMCAFHLIGVTALGEGCSNNYTPPVYTRISSYVNWLESVIWGPQ